MSLDAPRETPTDAGVLEIDLVAAPDAEDHQRVWRLVRHPHELARIAVAGNPHLTGPQAAELMALDQPLGVRIAAARTGHAGASAVAAKDPSPFVRAWGHRPTITDVQLISLNRLVSQLLPLGAYGVGTN